MAIGLPGSAVEDATAATSASARPEQAVMPSCQTGLGSYWEQPETVGSQSSSHQPRAPASAVVQAELEPEASRLVPPTAVTYGEAAGYWMAAVPPA